MLAVNCNLCSACECTLSASTVAQSLKFWAVWVVCSSVAVWVVCVLVLRVGTAHTVHSGGLTIVVLRTYSSRTIVYCYALQ